MCNKMNLENLIKEVKKIVKQVKHLIQSVKKEVKKERQARKEKPSTVEFTNSGCYCSDHHDNYN